VWRTLLNDVPVEQKLNLLWVLERGDASDGSDHVFLVGCYRTRFQDTTVVTLYCFGGGIHLPPFPEIPNVLFSLEHIDVAAQMHVQQLETTSKQFSAGFCAYWTAWFTIFVSLCEQTEADSYRMMQQLASRNVAYHLIQGFACDFHRDFYEEAREERVRINATWLQDNLRMFMRGRFYACGDRLPNGMPVTMSLLTNVGFVIVRKHTVRFERNGRPLPASKLREVPVDEGDELFLPRAGDMAIQTGRPSDAVDAVFQHVREVAKTISARGRGHTRRRRVYRTSSRLATNPTVAAPNHRHRTEVD
jgi:hypothetical protein